MSRTGLIGLLFSIVIVSYGVLIGRASEEISPEKKTAVKDTIRSYIEQDQKLKGAFLIKDERGRSVRELKFDHVHEGVHAGQGKYYACVDFKQQAKILDLDFYVSETPSGSLEISEIVIHKIDGKEVAR